MIKCIFCAFFRGILAQHKGQVTIPCLSESLSLIKVEKTESAFCTSLLLVGFFAFFIFFTMLKCHDINHGSINYLFYTCTNYNPEFLLYNTFLLGLTYLIFMIYFSYRKIKILPCKWLLTFVYNIMLCVRKKVESLYRFYFFMLQENDRKIHRLYSIYQRIFL